MKKLFCFLTAILILSGLAAALAEDTDGVVLFEGEKTGKFTNFNNWTDIVSVNLDRKKIDRSVFEQPFDILVEYQSDEAPVLFFMSWTGGTSKAQMNADETDGKTARYSYQTILRAYGDLFSKLGSVSVRANGANLTVTKITVVPVEDEGKQTVFFEGKAGEWLSGLKVGWNLGNTLDSFGAWIGDHKPSSKYETAWGNPSTTFEMLQMVRNAGFDVIRIPVTWSQHMDENDMVDEEWMIRVQTIVDWALEAGLKVIVNVHHDTGTEGWLRADLSKMDAQVPRFTRLWEQIAAHFADYDDRLAFEGYNELLDSNNSWNYPSADALAAANQLNQIFVDTVRASGGNNAERVLVCNTYAAAQDETTLAGYVLPEDSADHCLIAQVHVYSPIDFCFAEKDGYKATDWIAVNGKGEINGIVNRLYNHFTSKGIPVIIGEFSANAKKNEASRAEWAAYLTQTARREGIVCIWWDNGGQVNGGADHYTEMGLLNRRKLEWLYPDVVKALTGVDVNDPLQGKTVQDYPALYQAAAAHGFKLGACYSYSQLKDQNYLSLMTAHFNSITPTNELKAYSLLNMNKTRARDDGMPGLDWSAADKMLSWAQENNIKVRGHVLVWDAYMTDWFFREDYSPSKPYADQETVRARMAGYIREVMTHCEEKYPGVVYCWDVVNEAVGDSASEYEAGDARHLRTMRGGQQNLFRELAGDDYVEYAFLCARDTAESLGADIALFYNDYSTFYPEKRTAITALINSINNYAVSADGTPRKLVDGLGMQGYIGGYGTQEGCMSSNDVRLIRQTIEQFGDMGLQVQITEMAIRNYVEGEEAEKQHATFVRELFDMLASINTGRKEPVLTCVALWGVTDCNSLPKEHYTWKLNGPYCGLVTESLQLKPSFDSVYQALLAK